MYFFKWSVVDIKLSSTRLWGSGDCGVRVSKHSGVQKPSQRKGDLKSALYLSLLRLVIDS